MEEQFKEIQQIIHKEARFLLITHVNPDGDGIGSQIALHRYLEKLGKKSHIINCHPSPRVYRFLDYNGDVQVFDPVVHEETIRTTDVVFILDISNWDRLGSCGHAIKESNAVKICIDHHISNNKFADMNVIDETASSTGELIYRLITSGDGEITLDIAEPLYVSLITDTGSFRFSNTNSIAHRIAAHLIGVGVNPRGIYKSIYENSSIGRIKLLGLALSGLKMAGGERIAWLKITREMMESTCTKPQDCEGFVDYLRLLRKVEVCLLFIELEGGKVKVSLRSRGAVDVNKLAGEFGGGGHQHAAGLFIERSVEEMERILVGCVEETLSSSV